MKIYVIFIALCFSCSLSAQIFLGPTLGYDFASLETHRILKEGTIIINGAEQGRLLIQRSAEDDPAGRNSIVFGFQVQKMLSPIWSMGLRGTYAQKEYTEQIYTFNNTFLPPEYKLFYQQIGISVLFSRKIKDKFSVGIGPNVSHFSKWNSVMNRNRSPVASFIPYQVTKRSYGLDLQFGYYLGPIYLAVDYTRSLKVVDSSDYMKGASSLAISGTYLFEIKKRK